MVLVKGHRGQEAVCGALLRRTRTTEPASCYPTGGWSDPGYSM